MYFLMPKNRELKERIDENMEKCDGLCPLPFDVVGPFQWSA